MSVVTVQIVAHDGHIYGLTATGVYDIATYEEKK